jgi:hypothetical protein
MEYMIIPVTIAATATVTKLLNRNLKIISETNSIDAQK